MTKRTSFDNFISALTMALIEQSYREDDRILCQCNTTKELFENATVQLHKELAPGSCLVSVFAQHYVMGKILYTILAQVDEFAINEKLAVFAKMTDEQLRHAAVEVAEEFTRD